MEKAYESKKAREPTSAIPNVPICMDHHDHFSVYCDKQGRCQKSDCQGYAFAQCPKCDVRSSFTRSSNCFKEFYHSETFVLYVLVTILMYNVNG